MSNLLINEPPLQVLPSLAVLVGLEEAIILQQLHYWLRLDSSHEIEGKRWIYNSYTEWHEQLPFLGVQAIGRIFRRLESLGLVEANHFNAKASDRTKWYTIDYDALSKLSSFNLDTTIVHSSNIDDIQNEHSSLAENTTETTTEKAVPAKRAPVPYSEELKTELLEVYKDLLDPAFEIDFAMSHDAAKKSSNMNLYLRKWLNRTRRDEQANKARGAQRQPVRTGAEFKGYGEQS